MTLLDKLHAADIYSINPAELALEIGQSVALAVLGPGVIDALVEGLNVGLGIAGTVMTAADTLVPWYESMLKVSGLILDEVVRGMEDAHADDGDRAKRAGMAVTWALSNKRPEAALRWRGPRGWQDLDGFRRKIEATYLHYAVGMPKPRLANTMRELNEYPDWAWCHIHRPGRDCGIRSAPMIMRPPWGATMLTIDAGLRNTKLWDSISYDLRINALSSRSRQDAEGNPIPTPEPVPCYEGGGECIFGCSTRLVPGEYLTARVSWPDNRSTYDKGRVTIRSSYALAVLGNLLRGGKLLAQLRAHDIDLLRQAYNTDVVELLGTAPGGEIWHRELTRWGWIPVRGPDAPVEQGGRRMTDFAAAVDSTYSLCEARWQLQQNAPPDIKGIARNTGTLKVPTSAGARPVKPSGRPPKTVDGPGGGGAAVMLLPLLLL